MSDIKVEFKMPKGKIAKYTRGHNVQVSKKDIEASGAIEVVIAFQSKPDRSAFLRNIKGGKSARLMHSKGVVLEKDGETMGAGFDFKGMMNSAKNSLAGNEISRTLIKELAPVLVDQGINAAATAVGAYTGSPGLSQTIGKAAGRAAAKGTSKALDKEGFADDANVKGSGLRGVARQMHGRGIFGGVQLHHGAMRNPKGGKMSLNKILRAPVIRDVAAPLTKLAVVEGSKAFGSYMGADEATTASVGNILGNASGKAVNNQIKGGEIRVGEQATGSKRKQVLMHRAQGYFDYDPRPAALINAGFTGGSFKPVGSGVGYF